MVETGIFVEAAAPKCGPDCTEKFLNQDCYKYCVELSYKNVETGIFVQAAAPMCGRVCSEKFEDGKCDKYCVGLSYKNGFCFQSDPKISTYRCCCSSD
ncbi:hypothetical protein HID58_027475 [Brassica napus]|uniref:Defensin-like domain-containing protein n=1 Tax=Brassica napus TaxID=3708 RepID=A0ABQ8CRW7_BRANA|nr:hypothetical protein HID58_027475 [Brassica napus]